MSAYTPGPWHITETGPARHLRIDGPNDQMIAAVFRDQEGCARLIAAAPAMLTLLKRYRDNWPISEAIVDTLGQDEYNLLREVIANATVEAA